MYGQQRAVTRTRLRETAYAGGDKLRVDAGLDWEAGEVIGIAATNMRTLDFDECTIASYDSGTGEIVCEDDLNGYHFGDYSSTESDYGVDMRAEVMLYNRTIRIQASTDDIGNVIDEPWGCRVLVADFFETTRDYRTGNLIMDNVQMYNCSQKQTYKSALKWENAG